MASAVKLHIGGRERREGWTVLDISPGPAVDHVGSCTDLSFLADGSCAEVYASHVLEHLSYRDELLRALREINRVLQPGGRLRAAVPDLEILCKLFLSPALDGPSRFHVMRMMYGGAADEHDYHRVGLSFEFLGGFLHTAGFRNIIRVESFDLFADTSALRFNGVAISLNVEAQK